MGRPDDEVFQPANGKGLDLEPEVPLPGVEIEPLPGAAGVAMAALSAPWSMAPELRLLLMTGFLGGLTTFSTFSAEVVRLMQQGRLALAGAEITEHALYLYAECVKPRCPHRKSGGGN